MTCDVCHVEVQPIRHEFHVGVLRVPAPPPTWVVIAALYYEASLDCRSVVANFCGPGCSPVWNEGERAWTKPT